MALYLPICFLAINPFRTYSLLTLDRILSVSVNQKHYAFAVKPKPLFKYQVTNPTISDFTESYNFFSSHPLISNVTHEALDLSLTLDFLQAIDTISNKRQQEILLYETFAKVLAYRDLVKGQEIPHFKVDEVFDLGSGMPAFGLIPTDAGRAPILLFRGTDFSLSSTRGIASILSDLDPKGPGLSAFFEGRPKIHAWLVKVAQDYPKSKLVGCSLGGAIAIYTYLYENEWINQEEESCIFNPPGVASKIFRIWEETPHESLSVYVTEGDLIPKIGKLVGSLYQLAPSEPLRPIAAHVSLASASKEYKLQEIDLAAENLTRRFSR